MSHLSQIEHDPTVARRVASETVTATAYSEHYLVLLSERHHPLDILDRLGCDDQRGMTIDRPVPDSTSLVVARIIRRTDITLKSRTERFESTGIECPFFTTPGTEHVSVGHRAPPEGCSWRRPPARLRTPTFGRLIGANHTLPTES